MDAVKLDALSRVRSISKALFGSQYRLEVAVAVAVADPSVFFTRQIAETLGLPDNVVSAQLSAFEQAGLLRRHEPLRGQRALYLERVDSAFWTFCRESATTDVSYHARRRPGRA